MSFLCVGLDTDLNRGVAEAAAVTSGTASTAAGATAAEAVTTVDATVGVDQGNTADGTWTIAEWLVAIYGL